MSKTWKIIIGVLIALAIALGLIQRTRDPYTNYKPTGLQYQGTAQDMSLADFYNQGQSMAAGGQATSTTVGFLAVGDIMLSRNVAATIQKSGDIDLPFRQMADVLKSTDFNFANLESPDCSRPTGYWGKLTDIWRAGRKTRRGLRTTISKLLIPPTTTLSTKVWRELIRLRRRWTPWVLPTKALAIILMRLGSRR